MQSITPYFIRLILLCLFFTGGNPTIIAQVLPTNRAVDWSLAGRTEFPTDWVEVNIMDFGGINDGSQSNNTAFNNALAFLDGSPGILYFPEGDFLFEEALILPDQLILRGAGAGNTQLTFNLFSSDYAIQMVGTETDAVSFVTKNIPRGDTKLDVEDPDLFEVGDYVMVYDIDTAKVVSNWANLTTGQINQITTITGSRIRFRSPFRRDYDLSDEPRVMKIEARRMVGIEHLKIVREDEPLEKNSNIFFNLAANCWVQCIESENCDFSHVEIAQSTNIDVKGSYFHHAFDYGGGGKAYGVTVHYGSGECVVENNIFDYLRHSMLLQAGANGNVFSYNYSNNPTWVQLGFPPDAAGDLVLHGNYPYANLLEGNIVQNIAIDDSHGAQGPYNTLFRNRAERYGLIMGTNPPQHSQNLIGNEVSNTLGLFFISGSNHFLHGNNIRGNINPAGTNTLEDESYYMDSIPQYFQVPNAWPAIGVPKEISTVINEAYARYQVGAFVACTDAEYDPPVAPISSTSVVQTDTELQVYPNPANHRLFIATDLANTPADWQLLDLNGRVLRAGAQLPEVLELQNLQSGMYILSVRFNDGWVKQRFLVMRD